MIATILKAVQHFLKFTNVNFYKYLLTLLL